MADSPDLWILDRFKDRWQLIGALTLVNDTRYGAPPSKRRQIFMLFAWLRWVQVAGGVRHFSELLFAAMPSEGGMTSRPHWHVLIGGIQSQRVNVHLCFRTMARWRQLSRAFSEIHVFDSSLNGCDYVARQNVGREHATKYETGRISGRVSELILSRSITRAQFAAAACSKQASKSLTDPLTVGARLAAD